MKGNNNNKLLTFIKVRLNKKKTIKLLKNKKKNHL